MKLSQRINQIWFEVCALRGAMPQDTEDQRFARGNLEEVLFWLEAAQRRQEIVENGPLPKPHVAARPWVSSNAPRSPSTRGDGSEG